MMSYGDPRLQLTIELSSSENAEVERPYLPRLTTDYT